MKPGYDFSNDPFKGESMRRLLIAVLAVSSSYCSLRLRAQNGPGSTSQFQAFGDSITCGAGASMLSNSFEYWVGRAFGNAPVPHCLAGDDSYLIDGFILDPANVVIPSPVSISSLLEGTNNVGEGTDASHLAFWTNNIAAQYARLGIPSTMQLNFGLSADVSYAGDWTAVPSFSVGKASSSAGSTVTFQGSGTVLYLVTAATTGNGGNASLTCDNTMTGAQLLFQPPGGIAVPVAPNGSTAHAAQQMTRVVLPTGGSHSCTLANNSSIGKVDLIWASFLPGTPLSNAPRVLVFNIPPLNPPVPDTTTYRSPQQSVVGLEQGDGLVNILYIDDASTFSGPQDFYDQAHPVDYQHYKMSIPAIQALAASFGVPLPVPAYSAANSASYGTHNYGASSLSLSNLPNAPWVGTFNTSIGFGALQFDVTGSDNTADGAGALNNNLSGSQNTGIGKNALVSNSSGNSNTGVGFYALVGNATGDNNTAMGWGALAGNATGSENVAVGYMANYGNAGGANNVAVGSHANYAGGGGNNVAIGHGALEQNTAGDNVAVGANALGNNSIGSSNIGIGARSMALTTTGNQNIGIGTEALRATTTGIGNTALGYLAGQFIQQGSGNVALGWDAGPSIEGVSSSISLGTAAFVAATGAVQIGSGTNQQANTVQFGSWNFLDSNGNASFANVRDSGLSGNGAAVCSGAGGVLADCAMSNGGGQYLPLTGGTLAGVLDVNGASGSPLAISVHRGGVAFYNPGNNQFNFIYTDERSNLHLKAQNGGTAYVDSVDRIQLNTRAGGEGTRFCVLDGGCYASINAAGIFHETLSTPASSSAPCSPGDFTDDANYHYVCVTANQWKRVALSSF